jgi:hypothetical protein
LGAIAVAVPDTVHSYPPPPQGGYPPPPWPPPRPASGWSGGRVVSVVAGCVLALLALGLVVGGGAVLAWGATQRTDGYLTSATTTFDSPGYAITSERLQLVGDGLGSDWARSVLGRVRIHVTAADVGRSVFVGIARTADADRYLSGVAASTVSRVDGHRVEYVQRAGTAPAQPPGQLGFWTAQAAGTGRQTLTWEPSSGDWTVVVMNADASAVVAVRADVGATIPMLPWLATGMIAFGLVLAVPAVLLIAVPVRRVGRELRPAGEVPAPSAAP